MFGLGVNRPACPCSMPDASFGRRQALAAVLAIAAFTVSPSAALAADEAASVMEAAPVTSGAPQTVYFGNGCFWGRQKEFVDTEKKLGRAGEQVSAVVGYAGGKRSGPDGRVCYYYGPRCILRAICDCPARTASVLP